MVTAVAPPPKDEPPTLLLGPPDDGKGKGPWQRLMELMRLEWTDVFTLLAFALGVGLLSLVAPAAIEALVNTVAFGILLWPVAVLAMVMFALLFVAAVLRAMQTYVAECLQRRLFVRTALSFADRLARTGIESFDGKNRADIVNRFFEVSSGQKSIATLLVEGVGIIMMTLVGLIVLAFYHPYLLTFALVLATLVVFMLLVLGLGGVRTSIAESYAKFDVAAWLEEVARCPHTFRSGEGDMLAVNRVDQLANHYISTRRRHFAIIWRQTLFALMLEAVASTILLGLGGWLVINRQLTLGQLVASELIVTLVLAALSKIGKYVEIFYDLQATLDKLGVLDKLPPEPDAASSWRRPARWRCPPSFSMATPSCGGLSSSLVSGLPWSVRGAKPASLKRSGCCGCPLMVCSNTMASTPVRSIVPRRGSRWRSWAVRRSSPAPSPKISVSAGMSSQGPICGGPWTWWASRSVSPGCLRASKPNSRPMAGRFRIMRSVASPWPGRSSVGPGCC